nr:MAG TPA: hypothetical protein [Caudoviricetes sp.]
MTDVSIDFLPGALYNHSVDVRSSTCLPGLPGGRNVARHLNVNFRKR